MEKHWKWQNNTILSLKPSNKSTNYTNESIQINNSIWSFIFILVVLNILHATAVMGFLQPQPATWTKMESTLVRGLFKRVFFWIKNPCRWNWSVCLTIYKYTPNIMSCDGSEIDPERNDTLAYFPMHIQEDPWNLIYIHKYTEAAHCSIVWSLTIYDRVSRDQEIEHVAPNIEC